jgi:hypothetical protein
VLIECPELHCVSKEPMWTTFVDLIYVGHAGLALYTCFPLLCEHYARILELTTGQISPWIDGLVKYEVSYTTVVVSVEIEFLLRYVCEIEDSF